MIAYAGTINLHLRSDVSNCKPPLYETSNNKCLTELQTNQTVFKYNMLFNKSHMHVYKEKKVSFLPSNKILKWKSKNLLLGKKQNTQHKVKLLNADVSGNDGWNPPLTQKCN